MISILSALFEFSRSFSPLSTPNILSLNLTHFAPLPPSFSFFALSPLPYLDPFSLFKPNNFNKYIIRAMPTRKNSE
jgi:hypothetical protein